MTAPKQLLDFRSLEFASDPYPMYTDLRVSHPVHRLSDGHYVLSRFEDVAFALTRHDTFKAGWQQQPLLEQPWLEECYRRGGFYLAADPPYLTKLQEVVGRRSIGSQLGTVTPRIEERANLLVADIEPGQSFDFVSEFAYPLVAASMSPLFGLSLDEPEQIHQTRRWIELTESFTEDDPGEEVKAETINIVEAQNRLFDQALKERRRNPRNDIVSRLANEHIDGQLFSRKEQHDALNILLIGGMTPALQLPTAMITLAQSPELWLQLKHQPDRIPAFVEELIRHSGAGQATFRTAAHSVVLHDVEIPRGASILALIGAANRDPQQFDDPETFILSRANIHTQLGFGRGVHQCLGAAVARVILRISLQWLLRRFNSIHLAEQEGFDWYHSIGTRSLRSLTMHFL